MLVLVLGPVADLDVCFVDPRQTDGWTDGSSDNQVQPFSFLALYNILDQIGLPEKIHEWKQPVNLTDKAGPAGRLPGRPGSPKSPLILSMSTLSLPSSFSIFASVGSRPTTPRFGELMSGYVPRCLEVVWGQPNSVSLPWRSVFYIPYIYIYGFGHTYIYIYR